MSKRILLVEPGYKTRYPPFGLMKISTYHKMKGDEVVFVKGCNNDIQYQYWDRVYISTLFTWTWEKTISTIRFYHSTLFNFAGKCFVGGILASLMPDELFNETGIQPVIGLLDDPCKIEQDDDIIIDRLAPDYTILKQVENDNFRYSYTDAYLGYTTRGCVWKCEFCAVKTFEPRYIPYIDIKDMVKQIIKDSGKKQNLILMDNNVLASTKFDQIIDDIQEIGFKKGAVFPPTGRKRIVDFNQGLDARFLTEHKMQRLSEIPLEPMRIAFDSIEYKDVYVKAVRLAHKHSQREMSNYILYNFKDTPEDFYERLKINIDLNREFHNEFHDGHGPRTNIYSFPMRFIPLDAKKRNVYTGNDNWNRRYLRGLQVILNVMRGTVMPGREFFLQAFGRDAAEFKAILLMPDEFIRNRLVSDWRISTDYESRLMPYVKEWMHTYYELSREDKHHLISILGTDNKETIRQMYNSSVNGNVRKLLKSHMEEEEIVSKYKHT